MDFTLLRLILAMSVVVAHFREMVGGSPAWAIGMSSTVALQAFFVVSGWVVSGSYLHSKTTGGYSVRRFARLYPLYAFVVVVQTVLVLLCMDSRSDVVGETSHYLAANLAFLNFLKPTFLGFLEGARVAAINPSLWTLKIEVMFYICVPLCVFLTERYRWWAIAGLYLASVAYVVAVSPISTELAKQLPGQMRYFAVGMACRMLFEHGVPRPSWRNRTWMLVLGVVSLALAQRYEHVRFALGLQPLFVGGVVISGAFLLPVFRSMPDISYGAYLLHAPLIQFTQQLGLLPGDRSAFAPTILLLLLLSLAAYYLIERPAIRWGRVWCDRHEARFKSVRAAAGAA